MSGAGYNEDFKSTVSAEEWAKLGYVAVPSPREQICGLVLDTAPFDRALHEIKSRCLEPGNVPQGVFDLIGKGIDAMAQEVRLRSCKSAGTAGVLRIWVEIDPFGNFARAIGALRALEFNDENRHGDPPAKNGTVGADHCSGGGCCVLAGDQRVVDLLTAILEQQQRQSVLG